MVIPVNFIMNLRKFDEVHKGYPVILELRLVADAVDFSIRTFPEQLVVHTPV
jgi:hypothetical protein